MTANTISKFSAAFLRFVPIPELIINKGEEALRILIEDNEEKASF